MQTFEVHSPDSNVALRVFLEAGALSYNVTKYGVEVVARSPLGLEMADVDLRGGLSFVSDDRGNIDEAYTIPAFKKARCLNRANTLTLTLEKDGRQLMLEGRVYDDGAAVRLRVPGMGESAVVSEATGYRIPESAGAVYGMKHIFSYEDQYHPIPKEELHQNRLVFPVLVDAGDSVWALYAEAAVFGDYGGSSLCATLEDPLLLGLKMSEDKITPIQGRYPVTTPWRVAIAGDLDEIVNSNLLENLNPPSIVEDPSFIVPGVSAWSWMTENDSTRDPARCREYVDYAAEMGFPYYLADGGWPGHVDIPELVAYAAQRDVKIWIWEHCAAMRDPAVAEEKLSTWASWGVVGVKIDFFESDSPERMAQYDMLAELGARYRLMLNFHGATKPAGEIRTWPHVLTREGVMGGEYLQNFSTFLPGGPDAAHNCTLPFTRNAVGPMDYTPVLYDTYLTGTTDTHQTALMVIFTSYIQHVGEGRDSVLKNPCRPFLSAVPAAWDESRLLEGYPANYVTLARRSGDTWFVAGICARRPRSATFRLDFLPSAVYEAELYADDLSDLRPFDVANGALPAPDQALCKWIMASHQRPGLHQHNMHLVRIERFTVYWGDVLTIPLAANGGFAMILRAVA